METTFSLYSIADGTLPMPAVTILQTMAPCAVPDGTFSSHGEENSIFLLEHETLEVPTLNLFNGRFRVPWSVS